MARVAVFCSSSELVSPMFLAEAETLGKELALAGHQIIFGGADIGMMGRIANAALAAGGEVYGVTPELDFTDGIVHEGLTKQTVVRTLSERKAVMLKGSDAAVALPGGLGTLDEIFETLVLKVTGQWPKPFWFYNVFDFWKPTLEALTLMEETRMITRPLTDLIQVADRREDLLRGLRGI